MKRKASISNLAGWARGAFAALAVAASASSAPAVLTQYSPGDLFIGFRQTGVSNTLVANIGSATQFLPPSLGGTATGSFIVQFGFVPNTTNPVTNLADDLSAVFGDLWATNEDDGTGVTWAVAGFTDNTVDNSPISGFGARTVFLTQARTDPNVQTGPLPSVSRNAFSAEFNAFVDSIGSTSYVNRESTEHSSVAYIGDASGANNWNTRLGANGFNTGLRLEQGLNGPFSGPTNSVLDLWLAPNPNSSLTTTRTYLGSFTLNELGELTFTAVPEPATYVLLGLAATGYVVFRRRTRRKG